MQSWINRKRACIPGAVYTSAPAYLPDPLFDFPEGLVPRLVRRLLASFPGRRRNSLATSASSNCIRQRLRCKRMCRNIATTPSHLKLWTYEFSYVSWIWFTWVCWHIYFLICMSIQLESTIIKLCFSKAMQEANSWEFSYLPNPTSYGHKTCTIG